MRKDARQPTTDRSRDSEMNAYEYTTIEYVANAPPNVVGIIDRIAGHDFGWYCEI